MNKLLASMAVAATLMSAAPALAVTVATTTTFTFSGYCVDCSQAADRDITTQAELTLSNYTLGQEITRENFVSFRYDGSNLVPETVVITDTTYGVGGVMTSSGPAPQNFYVNGSTYFFYSRLNGNWGFGKASDLADYGTSGSYTQVGAASAAPEPATWAMLLLGFGMLAGTVRYRRRSTGLAIA